MEYETRVTQKVVVPHGEEMFDESATIIAIEYGVEGEFIKILQEPDDGRQEIRIDIGEEWDAIRAAVDSMVEEIEAHTDIPD